MIPHNHNYHNHCDHSHHHNDDGGAEKSSHRRDRRARRRILYIVNFVLGFILVVSVYTRSSGRAKKLRNHLDKIRHDRAEALSGYLKKGRDAADDGGGDDKIGNEWKDSDYDIFKSKDGKQYRWTNPKCLPPIPGTNDEEYKKLMRYLKKRWKPSFSQDSFKVKHLVPMPWEEEVPQKNSIPRVDYTQHAYSYPPIQSKPPKEGEYPKLSKLKTLFQRWPQDELDRPPSPIIETLLHFDYSNEEQRQMALQFRDAELPFKVYNVPEIDAATEKWTDDYLSRQFSKKTSKGHCQESVDNYFAFFRTDSWKTDVFGRPPTLDNNFSFKQFIKHARYADRVGLPSNATHYYWQSGVPAEEKDVPLAKQRFIGRDLPSFNTKKPNFFCFHPEAQKGIQCRFGERGVAAATHYDAGMNMVAMIKGAKRYVLAPPIECGKLGIINTNGHPTFRHSLLNFGYLELLDDPNNPATKAMPEAQKQWLKASADSNAIDTVLKEGEVLYIPSHWFHYIISLQTSAQCNVRSGRNQEGTKAFGGFDDVDICRADSES